MLVVDPPQDIANWVAAQYGCVAPSVDAAIGVADERGLLAGVFFDGMSENNIFAHIASQANVMPRSWRSCEGLARSARAGWPRPQGAATCCCSYCGATRNSLGACSN